MAKQPSEQAYGYTKKLADDLFSEWSALFTRMDEDTDLFNLVDYVLEDAQGNKVNNSIAITMNTPAQFALSVKSTLSSAIEQVTVTSKNKRFDTAYVEEVIRAGFAAADTLLEDKGLWTINAFVDEMAVKRGRVSARCLFQLKDGVLIPDILPYDTKYHVYWHDGNSQAGSAYKTTRSDSQVKASYPDATVPEGKSLEVLDIFTKSRHELWIASSQVKDEKNPFGYVPVVHREVPVGAMTMDRDSIQYQSESILSICRNSIKELNRVMSVMLSLTQKTIDHALQLKIPPDKLFPKTIPTTDQVTAPGTVNPVYAGGGYETMPIADLQASAIRLLDEIKLEINEAMGKRFQNLGTPKTATEIMAIGQEQDVLILPRLGTRGTLKAKVARMMINQIIALGKDTVKMGNTTYEVSKLKGEYEIDFKYFFKSPMQDIARTSVADASRGLIPDSMIRRGILQLEDPEGAERQLRKEEAERLSPLIKIRRTILSLIEDGENEEAEILCDSQYCPMLEQAIMGQQPANPTSEVNPTQPLVPLTVGGR